MILTKKNNISLTGFMGTGKSTVAEKIALLTGMAVVHIDKNIEFSAGTSINNIFQNQGEETFRALEKEEIKLIKNMENTVIDCGGGVILSSENRSILKENSAVIWLKASPPVILKRLASSTSRPLLKRKDRLSYIEKTLKLRRPFYRDTSDIIIDTDRKKTEEIAEIIIFELKKLNFFSGGQ